MSSNESSLFTEVSTLVTSVSRISKISDVKLIGALEQVLRNPDFYQVIRDLSKTNIDIFGCCPINDSLYQNRELWGNDTHRFYKLALDRPYTAYKFDLSATTSTPVPVLPQTYSSPEILIEYVKRLQNHFLTLLKVKEEQYIKLGENYLVSWLRHLGEMKGNCRKTVRTMLSGQKRPASESVKDTHFREFEGRVEKTYNNFRRKVLKLIAPAAVMSAVQEINAVIVNDQSQNESLLSNIAMTWNNPIQLTCIFQPILFHQNELYINDEPLKGEVLDTLNTIRRELQLPLLKKQGHENNLLLFSDLIKNITPRVINRVSPFDVWIEKKVSGKVLSTPPPKLGLYTLYDRDLDLAQEPDLSVYLTPSVKLKTNLVRSSEQSLTSLIENDDVDSSKKSKNNSVQYAVLYDPQTPNSPQNQVTAPPIYSTSDILKDNDIAVATTSASTIDNEAWRSLVDLSPLPEFDRDEVDVITEIEEIINQQQQQTGHNTSDLSNFIDTVLYDNSTRTAVTVEQPTTASSSEIQVQILDFDDLITDDWRD